MHKAKLQVDEKGSKASAATFMVGVRMFVQTESNLKFKCNRPFIFLLYDKYREISLFIGVYKYPELT